MLLIILHAVFLFVSMGLSVLVLVLLVEVLSSVIGPRSNRLSIDGFSASYVVVIPAHDEVGTIEVTLAAVLRQIDARGYVLVIADNCTDDTATVCAAAGARVIERQDHLRRGKGYALDFAVRSLAANPPDTVVVLDADCIPATGAIKYLVACCVRLGRPLQARYEVASPDVNSGPLARVGAFAWRVKNIVRPTGLSNLGLPCLLMGTGMVFPWTALAETDLATDNLVEDMVLGLELTAVGHAPLFLPSACVQTLLPPSIEGQTSQRTRWETGHLQVISKLVPRYLLRSFRTGNVQLFALALHAAVPPLAFLALLLAGTTAATALIMAAGGPSTAFILVLCAVVGALLALALSWHKYGRDLLSLRELLMLPGYVFSKLSIYAGALTGRKLQWERTKRD